MGNVPSSASSNLKPLNSQVIEEPKLALYHSDASQLLQSSSDFVNSERRHAIKGTAPREGCSDLMHNYKRCYKKVSNGLDTLEEARLVHHFGANLAPWVITNESIVSINY